MNLEELIKTLSKIGNQFFAWNLIDSNVDSVELLGNEKEGYNVKVKLKQEPINEEAVEKAKIEFCKARCPLQWEMCESGNWKKNCLAYFNFTRAMEEQL